MLFASNCVVKLNKLFYHLPEAEENRPTGELTVLENLTSHKHLAKNLSKLL